MNNNLAVLQPFEESDFTSLIYEIDDAGFLLQWAGPEYTYPLDYSQLNTSIKDNNAKIFKYVYKDSCNTAGHIQLLKIDYDKSCCMLSRVLIFKKYRGLGLAGEMVESAVKFAFEDLGLAEINLGVFDFNLPAVKTYKRAGFREFRFEEGARKFRNESWNLIRMKISSIS